MSSRSFQLAVHTLLLLAAMDSSATTVYKSVDAEGRVTFSDQPPPAAELVDVYEYREPPPNRSALDVERIEAMREVTERMAADRREREASRAGARTVSRYAQSAPDGASGFYRHDYRDDDYAPGFYGGHPAAIYYRPLRKRRPGVHPPVARPPIARPPAERPPLGRPPLGRPADSSHATRLNQYPAGLIRRHYTSAARRVFYGESWR